MAKHSETLKEWATMGEVVVGMDLSDRTARWCAVDGGTGEIREGAVTLTKVELSAWLDGVEGWTVVVEAGTPSGWIARHLSELGHKVVIVRADALAGGKRRRKKNDKEDAYALCRLGQHPDERLVRSIWQRPAEYQADLSTVRARDGLVRARTLLVNQVRGTVKSFGERLEAKHSAESLPRYAEQELSAAVYAHVQPLLEAIEALNRGLAEYNERLHTNLARRPESARLLQVHGVGDVTASVYMGVVGDPKRFGRSRDVAAYLGLAPWQDQSGEHDPQLGISKAGDALCRRILVQCAQYILGAHGKDSSLRRWGLALAGDGKNKARKHKAVVAVARKLAVLLHRLWVSGETYDALRGARGEAEEAKAA